MTYINIYIYSPRSSPRRVTSNTSTYFGELPNISGGFIRSPKAPGYQERCSTRLRRYHSGSLAAQ